jgi:hypothetical protein
MRQLDLPRLVSFAAVALIIAAAGPAAASEEDHHEHHNHAAVFVGATAAHDTGAATVGADYEHRLGGRIGVIGLADFAFFDHVTTILAAGAVVHPVAALKILATPGVEIAEGESAFVVRVGAGYDVHVGPGSITPTYNADVSDGHVAHVFGIAFGYGF